MVKLLIQSSFSASATRLAWKESFGGILLPDKSEWKVPHLNGWLARGKRLSSQQVRSPQLLSVHHPKTKQPIYTGISFPAQTDYASETIQSLDPRN